MFDVLNTITQIPFFFPGLILIMTVIVIITSVFTLLAVNENSKELKEMIPIVQKYFEEKRVNYKLIDNNTFRIGIPDGKGGNIVVISESIYRE